MVKTLSICGLDVVMAVQIQRHIRKITTGSIPTHTDHILVVQDINLTNALDYVRQKPSEYRNFLKVDWITLHDKVNFFLDVWFSKMYPTYMTNVPYKLPDLGRTVE